MPQGGDSEEKEDFKVRDPPWGVNGLNYILGTLVLGSNTEKISSLDCLEDSVTNRRAVGSLASTSVEHTPTCLLPRQGRDGGLKLHGWLLVSCDRLGACPSLS